MSKFAKFMRQNKIERKNAFYAATKSLMDENGEPLLWEIRPVTTKENERIREACTTEVPVKGKPGAYRPKMDATKYQEMLLCAAIVSPDLNDAELQDSYGVMGAGELLREMIDNAGEYTDLALFVQQLCGFKTLQESVDDAKN